MNATQNAKLGRTCTKRDSTRTRTHLQKGKLQLVYNDDDDDDDDDNNNNNKKHLI